MTLKAQNLNKFLYYLYQINKHSKLNDTSYREKEFSITFEKKSIFVHEYSIKFDSQLIIKIKDYQLKKSNYCEINTFKLEPFYQDSLVSFLNCSSVFMTIDKEFQDILLSLLEYKFLDNVNQLYKNCISTSEIKLVEYELNMIAEFMNNDYKLYFERHNDNFYTFSDNYQTLITIVDDAIGYNKNLLNVISNNDDLRWVFKEDRDSITSEFSQFIKSRLNLSF